MSGFDHYRVRNDHQVPELLGKEDTGGVYIEKLLEKLKIQVTKLTENDIEFDLIGVDVSIANALRRILLAEVPTIAIENVWIAVNNSIIQDEVLAHRVGLIPIRADPSKLGYVVGEEETDRDTIVFHFDVQCSAKRDENNESVTTVNDKALSGSLRWLPQGNQTEIFPEGVAPVHDDIVLAKLKPGQCIEFEAHCRKGVGKDHAKFSPVATASYRLLPDIRFKKPIIGESAYKLKSLCPMNVFDIEDLGGTPTAKVARPRDCTMCRECIRPQTSTAEDEVQESGSGELSDLVELRRGANHFLFSIESSGCIPPVTIVREAISILKEKAVLFLSLIDDYEAQL